jgi:TM2 domain-containing membrane protein YozV
MFEIQQNLSQTLPQIAQNLLHWIITLLFAPIIVSIITYI